MRKDNGTLLIHQRLRFILLLGGLIALSGFTSNEPLSNPWYVSIAGNNQSDCQTPTTPCATIDAVLQKPNFQDGDTILATAGHYAPPTTGEIALTLDRDITVSGAWDTTFSQQVAKLTYINGLGRTGIYITDGVSVTLISVSVSGGNFDPFIDFNISDLWYSDLHIRTSLRQKIHQEAIERGISSPFTSMLSPIEKGAIYNDGHLTLYHAKIQGLYGFGVRNNGTIIVDEDSEVHAEMGQAIYNDYNGTLSMINVDLSGSTGSSCTALGNNGIVEIFDSTVIYNVSEEAYGAICNAGEMLIENVVLESNYASGNYPNEPSGGAIHNVGTLTITNSLFLHNQAKSEGGAIYNAGNLALYNVTIMNNFSRDGVGGIWAGGTVQASNSVFAHNESYFGAPDCTGTIHSLGYNLIQYLTDCEWQEATGDIMNVPVLLSVIPPYWYLTQYSPVRDAGNPNGCLDHNGNPITTDVYGRPRIGRCDIGALEYNPDNDPFHYHLLPFVHRADIP